MFFNQKFFTIVSNQICGNYSLDLKLEELINNNFVIKNQCYLLNSLYQKNTHIEEIDFSDKTSYEYFINSIHIDDYVSELVLVNGILFINRLCELWDNLKTGLCLNIVLSETDHGFNVKFYVNRIGEEMLDLNLSEISECGILILKF